MKDSGLNGIVKSVIVIVVLVAIIYGSKVVSTYIKTCAEPGCDFRKEKGFDYCYRHMKEHGLDYDFSDSDNETDNQDNEQTTKKEEITYRSSTNNSQFITDNYNVTEKETTRKTYNYSNSSNKNNNYHDSYDDGYEDVYFEDDYDDERYYEDDDYAEGVDDAIDEMDEEGEGDW